MNNRLNVIFICNRNSCRSQMAEAFVRKHAGDRFHVFSAGLHPDPEIHPYVYEVMDEVGLSLDGQRPKSVKEYMARLTPHYLIITMKPHEEHCPRIFPGMQIQLHWPFDDPRQTEGTKGERLSAFRRVRDHIQKQVLEWLEGISEHEGFSNRLVSRV